MCAAEEEDELKKSTVVNWYLKEIESEIDSEEELVNKKGLIEKVIHRLVHYVSPPSANKTQALLSKQQKPTAFNKMWHACVSTGSHPHRAVPGRAEGIGARQLGTRSCSGCQPQLHPGGLTGSLHAPRDLFLDSSQLP